MITRYARPTLLLLGWICITKAAYDIYYLEIFSTSTVIAFTALVVFIIGYVIATLLVSNIRASSVSPKLRSSRSKVHQTSLAPPSGVKSLWNDITKEKDMEQMVIDAMQLISTLVNLDEVQKFENDVFSIESYCWCDEKEPGHESGCPPNFVHKSTGLCTFWYKHPGRDMEFSDNDEGRWRKAIIESVASLK